MMIAILSGRESRRAGLAIAGPFWCDAGFFPPAQMLHFVQHDHPLMS